MRRIAMLRFGGRAVMDMNVELLLMKGIKEENALTVQIG